MKKAFRWIIVVFSCALFLLMTLNLLGRLPFPIHGSPLTPMLAIIILPDTIEILRKHRWYAILLRAAQALLVVLAIVGTVFIFLPLSKNLDSALTMAAAAFCVLFGFVQWRQRSEKKEK